jgi:hypothetical protein
MREGGTQPERRKQKGYQTYRLVAVTTYMVAYTIIDDDRAEWYRGAGHVPGRMYPDRMIQNMATKAQLKWVEVANTDIGLTWRGESEDKHLVWERVDMPRTGEGR